MQSPCRKICFHDPVRNLCAGCGRTLEEVERTLDRDHFMTAEEAKAWGIIDHVYVRRDDEAAA